MRYDAGEIIVQIREEEITAEDVTKAQKSEKDAYEVLLACQARAKRIDRQYAHSRCGTGARRLQRGDSGHKNRHGVTDRPIGATHDRANGATGKCRLRGSNRV